MRTISPGSISRTYCAFRRSKAQVSLSDEPGVAEFAEIERTEAARIADGVEFVGREDEEGVRAFDLIEGVAERAGKIARLRAREKMNDDFGVAVGLKDRAAMFELAAPLGGVGEVAVVAERDFALVAVDHDRLRVEQRFVSGGGVARVADGEIAGKICEDRRGEDFFDFAHGAVEMELGAVAGDDAGGFLAAMLERVEAEVGELRGFFVAEDAEDATVVVEVIVFEDGEICRHFGCVC